MTREEQVHEINLDVINHFKNDLEFSKKQKMDKLMTVLHYFLTEMRDKGLTHHYPDDFKEFSQEILPEYPWKA